MGERIEVEADTYDALERLKREDETFDDLVRLLLNDRRGRVRAGPGLWEGTDASEGARTARAELKGSHEDGTDDT